MPVYDVTLGRDVETDKVIQIGDMERRSGLYILGRPGSGKTTLIKNIIAQDIDNGASIMAPATPFCFWTTQKHLTVKRTMGSVT